MASLGELFQNPEELARSAGQASLPTPYSQPDAIPTAQAVPTAKPNSQELDAYAALKAEQESALGQHREYAARMENVQNALKTRESDLDLVGRINAMLDPSMDKGVRAFLYKEMARNLHIDPKGGTPKEVGAMLLGLDPQTAGTMRSLIGELSKNTDPGTVRELMAGIMTGKVPMHEVAAMARKGAMAQSMQTQQNLGQQTSELFQPPAGGDGMMKLGGPKPEDGAAPPMPTLPKDPFAGASETKKPVGAAIQRYMGDDIDKTQRYTHEELRKLYPSLPETEAERIKMAEEFRKSETAFLNLMKQSAGLEGLIRGKPEALAGIGVLATTVESMKAAFEGLGNVFGRRSDDDVLDRGNQRLLDMAAKQLASVNPGIDAAVARSMIAQLGFVVAATAFGQEGRSVTKEDYANALRTLGAAQSPDQMQAVLRDLNNRIYEVHASRVQTCLGRRVEMSVEGWSVADMVKAANSPVTPEALKPQLEKGLMAAQAAQQAAKSGQAPAEGGAPAGGTPKLQGSVEERERQAYAAQLAEERQKRSDRELALGIAKKGDSRADEQLGLAKEAGARAERGEQRADRQEKRAIANDAKREAEKRQERIQAAFQALAKAMQGGSVPNVMGGSSNAGGDQDARAFVMPQPPQRRAPSPGRSRD